MEINKVYKVAILISGREIVFEEGFENVEDRQGPIWKNPMNIALIPIGDGKGQVSLNPTCTFGGKDYILPVDSEKVVTIYDLDPKLNATYEGMVQRLSAQKSGIEIIPAGGVPKIGNISKHPSLRNIKRRKR